MEGAAAPEAVLADPAAHLAHADAASRRLAVSVLAGAPGELPVDHLARVAAEDPVPEVRAAAVEALAAAGDRALAAVEAATADGSEQVVEAAAYAFGEIGDPVAVPWLTAAARGHADRLVREAAVASLGAIGDPTALPILVELAGSGPPQVRRRAVVALTAFDAPEAEAAIRAAAKDRNPMVREVAEMVVGPAPPRPEDLLRRPQC